MKPFLPLLCLLALAAPLRQMQAAEPSANPDHYDIVIYGGTSGGIAAGVQASRMGKSVVIIEPTPFLGGLTTGGLGATDIGNKRAIGGISREFYHLIWKHYQNDPSWTQQTRDEYFSHKRQPNTRDEQTMWTFEPHVASKVYDDMIAAAKVPVVRGERLKLDRKNGVTKEEARITAITMESGRTFTGEMFIDATYEGDLLAMAGVSYHVGREANTTYNETLNGVQAGHARSHQFQVNVDPYRIPGNPTSGLLPGIDPAGPGEEFSGDHRVQAYNFRMCTTDVPENRLPWPKPENYDEKDFELALRNVEAGDLRFSWNPVWMPNRKTDTNNNFAVSTDNIGANYAYPDASYGEREKIVAQHRYYQMGLMWTYAHHPRVPETIRSHFQNLGLAKDEFADNQNWPRQLYIREARRMISEYVMTEHHCRRMQVAKDSVGMGAYNMDSHHTQRYVTSEGFVRNEGDVQVPVRPYPISYQSIRPKAEECTNLLVPVCLSSSHIAFGSIRMEPVFMVLGQSAATAASLAIDANLTVQQLPYEKLEAQLLKDQQVLDFESPPLPPPLTKKQLGGIVIDDSEAQLTGFDAHGSSAHPFVGQSYSHDGNESKGDQKAVFQADLPSSGSYEVRIAFTALNNRASNVPVTIHAKGGSKTILVDQRKTPPIDNFLLPLGKFDFDANQPAVVEISNKDTDGHVIIDAVQWIQK
jgi:hypothetical protein